jgi:hypothetical protein
MALIVHAKACARFDGSPRLRPQKKIAIRHPVKSARPDTDLADCGLICHPILVEIGQGRIKLVAQRLRQRDRHDVERTPGIAKEFTVFVLVVHETQTKVGVEPREIRDERPPNSRPHRASRWRDQKLEPGGHTRSLPCYSFPFLETGMRNYGISGIRMASKLI